MVLENIIKSKYPYNDIEQILKKDINVRNHLLYTLARTNKMFIYENLPDTIPEDILEKYLQSNGFAIIAKYKDEIYAYFAGLGGIMDEYYRPSTAIINNPYQNFNAELKIDKECVLVKNDSFMMGLIPLISKYSYLLSENEISLKMAEINLRIQSIITADTDNKKEAADAYVQGIINGDIKSIIDKGLEEGIKTKQFATAGGNNSITQLIELEQFLKGSLLNELGLQANFNMKRETLNDAELSANIPSLKTLINDMYIERKKGIEKINKMFNTNINVKINPIWEGGFYNESERNGNNIQEHPDSMEESEISE